MLGAYVMSDATSDDRPVEVLQVRELCKRRGRRMVIDELSMTCESGEITILTGDNGAGKSTLLALVGGVLSADRGSITIAGTDLRLRPRAARQSLGYVPEAANPPGYMTGAELYALVCRLKGAAPLSAETSQALGLERLTHARIERLSLGERRRVCLGAALIGEPSLLVLDEPTNGLDLGGVATLLEILRERKARGAAILIATHDRVFADEVADIRLHLRDGQFVDA